MNADRFKYKEITDIILRSFYEAQLINYLKATNIEEPCSPAGTGSTLCYDKLLGIRSLLRFKRFIYDNKRKNISDDQRKSVAE